MSESPSYSERRFRGRDDLDLYYRDYPDASGSGRVPLLCIHGLTRNSRDFEAVAADWARERRVLVPDVRGRGRSQWDPSGRYNPAVYAADMLELLDDAGEERAIAIGTSMGGLISMTIAMLAPDRLAAVALNDVGPVIDPRGLARILGYVGKTPDATSWDQAAATLRELNAQIFPDWTDADWRTMARRTFRETGERQLVPDYDPAISGAGGVTPAAVPDAWPLFEALSDLPALVLRGETSDILSAETLAEMCARKPGLHTAIVPKRGHAPTLEEPAAREAIAEFLSGLR